MDRQVTIGTVARTLFVVLVLVLRTRGDNPHVFIPSSALQPLTEEESANLSLRCSFPFDPPLNPTFSYATPIFLHQPQDVTFFGDDHAEIQLTCAARNADQRVSWFFKQEGVGTTWVAFEESQSEASQVDNTLIFAADTVVTLVSAGYYRCSVSAGAIGSIVSRAARLELAQVDRDWQPFQSDFTEEDLSIVGVVPGSSLSIPCDVSVTSWSAVNVSWHLDGKVLPLRKGVVVRPTTDTPGYALFDDGTLLLDSIPSKEEFDGHVFRCSVSSPTSKHASLSKGVQLKISQPGEALSSSQAVHVLTSNPDPFPGNQVTLVCVGVNFTSAGLNELPAKTSVEWFFNGVRLPRAISSSAESFSCESLVASDVSARFMFLEDRMMVLCGFDPLHSGNYTCAMRMSSIEGTVQKQATVAISLRVPPQRFPPDYPLSVDLPAMAPDEHQEIDCSSYVSASSPAVIQWLYKGKPVKSAVDVVRNAWLLTINGSYHGMYQCIVSNQWGHAQLAFRVRMKSAPGRIRFRSRCANTRRKNYFCFEQPSNHSSSITHYLIGVRTTRWSRRPHTIRSVHFPNQPTANSVVMIEGCTGEFYTLSGCSYLVTACNAFGCGQPKCIFVRAPPHRSSVGILQPSVSPQSFSSVKLSAVVSARDMFNKAIFLVRNKTNQLQTSKLVTSSRQPVPVELSIGGLESCTQYEACGQLGLRPELSSFMTFFQSSRLDCGDDPAMWQPFKTPRSPVPKTAPSISKVYRVSPKDAIVVWKPVQWCELYPHTVFDVSYASGLKSVLLKSHCIANTAIVHNDTAQVFVHRSLQDSKQYSLYASSCVSNKGCESVLDQRDLCSSRQEQAVNIPQALSWPVTIETSIIHNKTGRSTLAVEWTVSKDFHTLLPSARLQRHCHGEKAVSSLILNVNMAEKDTMKMVLPAQVTNCSMWMEANFPGEGQTTTPVSNVQTVELSTETGESSVELESNNDRTSTSSQPVSSSLYVQVGAAVGGLLLLFIFAGVYVRHRRRRLPVVDRNEPIYEEIGDHEEIRDHEDEEGPYDVPETSWLLPIAFRIEEWRRKYQRL